MRATFRPCAAALAALTALAWSGAAGADVTHIVARGHTLDAIAHRYHVTAKSILDANHLKDPNHLRVGDTLTIPGVTSAAPAKGKTGHDAKGPTPTYAMRAKTPGVVHVTRLATNEDFVVRVASSRGRVSPTSEKTFERMMRNGANLVHPIDPRLIALVGIVSNHFGSRRLEVISGFRPFTPTQYTAHSNHNIGHAIDFRVVGVPNEVLRDYCKTLHNVGVGYYPNSTFVHLDVRATPAFWIDYSRPGEAPRYNAPNLDADEGTSDVADESHAPEAPSAPETDSPTHDPVAPAAPDGATNGMSAPPSPIPMATTAPSPTSVPSPTPSPAGSNPTPLPIPLP